LFELLTGEQPFVTETSAELAAATIHRTPRKVNEAKAGVPLALVEIVSRCLEREPEKRWATAHQLSEQLEDFVSWSGTPLRSSDLGGLLSSLGIEPHTVSSSGTPSLSDVPSFVSVWEPIPVESFEASTFEPVAELSVEGKLHVLENMVKSAPAEQPFTHSGGGDPGSPAEAAVEEGRQNRFAALELDPIAGAVERKVEESNASPPATGARWKTVAIGLVVVAVLGVAAFGVSKLKLPGKPAAPGALFIDSTPSGATVLLGGEAVGQTPWAGDNAAGGVTTIVLKRPGFADTTLRIDGGTDWSGTVKLSKGSSR
jgi:serine/threonine-protein kinase